jgi:predicted esterase/predicted DNA-binding protein (MmcQ/YjbR family)
LSIESWPRTPEDRQVLEALRALCSRLPEVDEQVDGFGHVTFKVRKKSFVIAGMGETGEAISIKSDPATQEVLTRSGPYYRTPYIGQHGWVSIAHPLSHDWPEIEELVVDGYRRAAPKGLARRLGPGGAAMALLLALAGWGCASAGGTLAPGDAGTTAGPATTAVDAAAAFEAVEDRLMGTDGVVEFRVTAGGAFTAALDGVLRVVGPDEARLVVDGQFGGAPVALTLLAGDGRMVGGNQDTTFRHGTSAELRESLILGFTRMGILHNLARLVAGRPPDHADGGVREWVQVADVAWVEDAAGSGARGLGFEVVVSGTPAARAEVVLDAAALPRARDVVVRFPGGEMTVREEYSFPDEAPPTPMGPEAGAAAKAGLLARVVDVDGTAYGYRVQLPAGYTPDTAWPVILFLHGSGERGDDGVSQTAVGLGPAARAHPERFPTIIVYPQAPLESRWSGAPARAAMAALRQAMTEFRADPDRVYLTGLSMGGNGAWRLAYEHPGRFAALVPICGWVGAAPVLPGAEAAVPAEDGDPFEALAERLAPVPVWIFHGEEDPAVPVEESRRAAAALEAAGGNVRYTELPGVGHNAWDPAYGSASLAEWLFAQRRRPADGS